jgi:hypothetical protein
MPRLLIIFLVRRRSRVPKISERDAPCHRRIEQRPPLMPSKLMPSSHRRRRSFCTFLRTPDHNVDMSGVRGFLRRVSIVAMLASVFASSATIFGYCLYIRHPDISREPALQQAQVAPNLVKDLGHARACHAMVGDQPFHGALLWSRTGEVIDPTNAASSDRQRQWALR